MKNLLDFGTTFSTIAEKQFTNIFVYFKNIKLIIVSF